MTGGGHHQILVVGRPLRAHSGGHVDEELKQLDLAVAETRRLATEALDELHAPQAVLRTAAADYVESVAQRRVDASRRASIGVMAKLSDSDIVELRVWALERVVRVRAEVESDMESCDFWIVEASGLSLTDVTTYGAALAAKPKDSKTGIPQTLVLLFERRLRPLRQGLAAVGLVNATDEAEPLIEARLVRAWRAYRDMAIDCLVKWADIDDRYQASAARFQEMRWELAGDANVAADAAPAMASAAEARIDASVPDIPDRVAADVFVRQDAETLALIRG